MTSIYSWESFLRIHGGEPGARDVFERVMEELLRAENPGKEVHIVKASQGDGGIDVCVHQEDGIDIYQCKFFMGSMNSSRWSQIKDSFFKAMEPKGVTVLHWVLCMPRQMQKEDIVKLEAFKRIGENYGVEIQFVDGYEIIYRMRDCDRDWGTDLIERYFGTSQVLPKSFTNRLPIGPEIGLVGRDEIVEELRVMLDEEICVALVRGIGGIGKTAVMQKVCNKILTDGNDRNHVAWISCGDSLEDDLLVLSDVFGISMDIGREDAFKSVLGKMKGIEGRLYLFLDDLSRDSVNKDLETLNALRPNVHVMITSRRQIKGIPHLELHELNNGSVIDMFYGYYERDKERKYLEDARGIIDSESVKRHTLLVELLAKAANRSFDTLDVFRGELEKKGFFKVSRARLNTAHDENLTIEESVIKLYGISELSTEQRRIMSLFSIFTPEKVIYGKVVEWAGFDENDVEGLVQLGWLVRTEGGYVIHQIVRDSLARQVGGSLKIEEYGELLEKVADLRSYVPGNLMHTKVRERLILAEDVAKYVDEKTSQETKDNEYSGSNVKLFLNIKELFHNIGGVYETQSDYKKALECYRKVILINERVWGTDQPDTATTYNNIGNVYQNQGDYEKALEYYEKAVLISEQALGTDHPLTALTYNNIGTVYWSRDNYKKALEYYEKAVLINEQALGIDHPYTAATYTSLGGVYWAQRNYEKALEYYEKAVLINERVLGTDHPATANVYNNIGNVYQDQDDCESALYYYEKALSINERVLGTDHPSTAASYNNIAIVYQVQGRYEKALEYYEKAFSICERVLGIDHPSTVSTYNNMRRVHDDLRNYVKRWNFFGKTVLITSVFSNIRTHSAVKAKNIMDNVQRDILDHTKAAQWYENYLDNNKRILDSDYRSTVMKYNHIALTLKKQCNYARALETYEKALEIGRLHLRSDHPLIAMTYNNMAEVYETQGFYEKALEYYEEALTVYMEKLGANHSSTQNTLQSIQKMKSILEKD